MMKTVEVFKTNVEEEDRAKALTTRLLAHYPHYKVNFDLQDCDRILRVEGVTISHEKIIELINSEGYQCHVLE
jgi:hypothetical protein